MSSKSLNKVTLIGNVTRDPDLRYTPQGNAVCTFGLATNRSWKTDGGDLREEAEFHRLVAWNKLAELCSQLCTKGRKIYVEGRLQTRTFTGSDNAQHTITEIVIDDMILLDSRPASAQGYGEAKPGAAANGPQGFRPSAPSRGAVQLEPAAVEEPVSESVETSSEEGEKEKKSKSKSKARPKSKANSDESPGESGKVENKVETAAPSQPETPAETSGTTPEEKVDIDDIPF